MVKIEETMDKSDEQSFLYVHKKFSFFSLRLLRNAKILFKIA